MNTVAFSGFPISNAFSLKFSLHLHVTDINVLSVPPPQFPAGVVIGVVVGVLLLVFVSIGGFFAWKRHNNGKYISSQILCLTLSGNRIKLLPLLI